MYMVGFQYMPIYINRIQYFQFSCEFCKISKSRITSGQLLLTKPLYIFFHRACNTRQGLKDAKFCEVLGLHHEPPVSSFTISLFQKKNNSKFYFIANTLVLNNSNHQ